MISRRQILLLTVVSVLLLVRTVPSLGPGETAWAAQQTPTPTSNQTRTDLLSKILEFVYTASHALGQLIMSAVRAIFPNADIPTTLVDAIGFLSLLTATLIIAEIAKKLVWIVVGIGWILIAIRVALIIIEGL